MDKPQPRTEARRFFALIVIGASVAQAFGLAMSAPTMMEANDISRWCTVWSLLERGSYVIDDCPWEKRTQDKIKKAAPFSAAVEGKEPVKHFYSSKPPLLPTMIAGVLYPARALSKVPLDAVTNGPPRVERWVQKGSERVLETPKDPIKWAVQVYYFKPIIILLNIVPMAFFLILYARLLDRYAANDWAWFVSLVAAGWGNQLFVFDQTLNNHTVAAYSAFFALYFFLRIWDEESSKPGAYALAGFFAAFCACNELPAASFGLVVFGMLVYHSPRRTLLFFAPAAAIPCAAFLATQYLAMGTFRPAYEGFGTEIYEYEGSFWTTPLEFDWFNKHPEPKSVYLFHMLLGHHGVFSLTPIFLFSIVGAVVALRGRARGLAALAWMTSGLTVATIAFYATTGNARNYGGSTQGLRWLFWLFPSWLILLPAGLEAGGTRKVFRWASLAALMLSVFSVGYAMRTPWSHPWILDALEHLNLYQLNR